MKSKIKKLRELIKILRPLKSSGKKIVFTNGCFDILHLGHITYLRKARKLGDILIVGLNSDRSVKAIKGSSRPINREMDRAGMLAALASVDFVVIFDEATPENLIRAVKPDTIVKGGDWKTNKIVGADFVKSYGGCVKTIPFVKGYSTTRLVKKIAG